MAGTLNTQFTDFHILGGEDPTATVFRMTYEDWHTLIPTTVPTQLIHVDEDLGTYFLADYVIQIHFLPMAMIRATNSSASAGNTYFMHQGSAFTTASYNTFKNLMNITPINNESGFYRNWYVFNDNVFPTWLPESPVGVPPQTYANGIFPYNGNMNDVDNVQIINNGSTVNAHVWNFVSGSWFPNSDNQPEVDNRYTLLTDASYSITEGNFETARYNGGSYVWNMMRPFTDLSSNNAFSYPQLYRPYFMIDKTGTASPPSTIGIMLCVIFSAIPRQV